MLCSAALITGFAPEPIVTPRDFLLKVVLNEQSSLFETWLGLGALLAAPVFASSVVAIPALLDQPADRLGVYGAVLTSWRVVLEHPAPMALWAALLMGLTTLGLATALLGLIVIVPGWATPAGMPTATSFATAATDHVGLYRSRDRPVRPDLWGRGLHAVHGLHHPAAGARGPKPGALAPSSCCWAWASASWALRPRV